VASSVSSRLGHISPRRNYSGILVQFYGLLGYSSFQPFPFLFHCFILSFFIIYPKSSIKASVTHSKYCTISKWSAGGVTCDLVDEFMSSSKGRCDMGQVLELNQNWAKYKAMFSGGEPPVVWNDVQLLVWPGTNVQFRPHPWALWRVTADHFEMVQYFPLDLARYMWGTFLLDRINGWSDLSSFFKSTRSGETRQCL
jgi:hypothetical protein